MVSSAPLISLGAKLQKLRSDKGLTLEEVARSTGVSTGVLSQIERGHGNPSFLTLVKIAKGFGVPVNYFLSAGERPGLVVRRDERKKLIPPSSERVAASGGLVYELLSPDLHGNIELLWIEYAAGVDTSEMPFIHEGEECGVILRGRLEVHVADQCYFLEEGDSIYFASSVPHWFRNPGSEPAVMVWAISPPSF